MKSKVLVSAAVLISASVMAAASVLTGGLAQAGTAATASKSAPVPLICSSSYDPYQEAASILRACGDVVLPLRHVTPMPGGGKAYDYGDYTQFVPPPHFNVLTATDKQLQEYGLPTRQKLGTSWYATAKAMRHFVKPAPYLVEVPGADLAGTMGNAVCSSPGCSHYWSGYAAYRGHSYTGIGTGWYEPAFSSSNCSATAFAQWIGIGGLPPSKTKFYIGQAGTAFGVPNIGANQAWIDAIDKAKPASPPVVISGLYATKDQKFVASESFDSANHRYYYSMGNDFTGDAWSGESRVVNSWDHNSAEVITERPVNISTGLSFDLTNYGSFNVTGAGVDWGTTGSAGLAHLPGTDVAKITMKDSSGNTMSLPGLFDSNSDFSNTWFRCAA